MPRISKDKAARHRDEITGASASMLKQHGLRGVSISDLMGAVGLTHGGFYSHFETKDALILAAVDHAYDQTAQQWLSRAEGKTASEARAELLDHYLDMQHVQNVETGCPTAAFVGDMAREPMYSAVRLAFSDGVERLIKILASLEPGTTPTASRSKSLVDYATIVGTIVLARATEETLLSDELLAAAREHVIARVASTDTAAVATAENC